MIVIAGTVRTNPAARDAALKLARWMSAQSEAEPGCISYRFYESIGEPGIFFIFEEWKDENALKAHFETPHMAEFRKHLPEIVAGPMDIKRYNVSSVTAE